jgi:uncharacterized protein YrrD
MDFILLFSYKYGLILTYKTRGEMKRSLKDLTGFEIEALDGLKGKVKDFLFDEETWIIRYMEADLGNLFKGKRVLVPGIFFKKPDLDQKHFPVGLNIESVENCPSPDDRLTVSREYERKLSEYYGYNWPWTYAAPVGTTAFYPSRPVIIPEKVIDEKEVESTLRSFKEVKGYSLHAVDGRLGHIDDIIVDEDDWQIIYVIADTSNWLPWSKKVMLPINRLKNISYVKREVMVDLHTEVIKDAPDFDADNKIEPVDEQRVIDYYNSKSLVTR